tara:strand:- start:353 stop:901 length:549 start_codon:yes stop_codon:yes gene_type:complete
MHTVERQADQLAMAGITDVPPPDLSMVRADLSTFDLPDRFVMLVSGSAPHRPDKRWPVDRYGDLCERLRGSGLTPVVIGGPAEREIGRRLSETQRGIVDLVGQTSFEQIAMLAQKAAVAVGNDTGPMHIAATAGCPSVVLFSQASDPLLTAPRGRLVKVLQRDRLEDLSVDEVAHVMNGVLA